MYLFRTSRAASRVLAAPATAAPSSITSRRWQSDYGSGEVNSEPNSSADKEHPGPPPPKVAQKGTNHTSSTSASQADAAGSTSAQPKIHQDQIPDETQQSEDVKKHNAAMRNRGPEGQQQEDGEKDKVGKGFWSGES
jgi:hypothetical protein